MILPALPGWLERESEAGVGAIGELGTTHTTEIVGRFLDAVLGAQPSVPTAAALCEGMSAADSTPFE